MDVTDTAAIVTGGASGLGAAVARRLAHRGSRVFGVDLEHAVRAADPADGLTLVAADVTDATQVRAAVAQASGTGLPLRVVVNCAGIGPSTRTLGRAGPHDLDLFRKVVEVNLIGTFTVLSIAAAVIAQTEPDVDGQRGVVVNTASIAAFEGQIGQVAYAAAHGAPVRRLPDGQRSPA